MDTLKTYDHTNFPEPCKCSGVIEARMVDQATDRVLEIEQFDLYTGRCMRTVTFENRSPDPDENLPPVYKYNCREAETEYRWSKADLWGSRRELPTLVRCTLGARDLRPSDPMKRIGDEDTGEATTMEVILEKANGDRFRQFLAKRDNYPTIRSVGVNYHMGLCKAGSWARSLAPDYKLEDSAYYGFKIVEA